MGGEEKGAGAADDSTPALWKRHFKEVFSALSQRIERHEGIARGSVISGFNERGCVLCVVQDSTTDITRVVRKRTRGCRR